MEERPIADLRVRKGVVDIVYLLTAEIHEDVSEIYEVIMDEEPNNVVEGLIDRTVRKLKDLKDSVIKRRNEI